MKFSEYEAIMEAVLFAAGEAVSLASLSKAAGLDVKATRAVLRDLCDKLNEEGRGVRVIEINDKWQMCTSADYFEAVSTLIQSAPKKNLTPPLLETLAIIAYMQPVTKPQIEEIRGVDAGHAVNRLLELGLACERGRLDAPGKPILFGTTDDFLKHFGFSSLDLLPGLPTVSQEEIERTMLTEYNGEYTQGTIE